MFYVLLGKEVSMIKYGVSPVQTDELEGLSFVDLLVMTGRGAYTNVTVWRGQLPRWRSSTDKFVYSRVDEFTPESLKEVLVKILGCDPQEIQLVQ